MSKTNLLSKEELERYGRHIILSEFGEEGQKKLKDSKVLVIGAGGLGAPVLHYLAAAGVGTIGIVDFDVVDVTNLQRQVLFSQSDVGKLKTEVAKERLEGLNPYISIKTHTTRLSSENALEIIKQYDIVADGTDNFQTRYLVNDACIIAGKTNVYASINRFDGQVSVFNYAYTDGSFGPNYRDLFPEPPDFGTVLNCAENGVLGVLPGIIGSLQANEVIKIITGLGNPLIGKLFLFNALTLESNIITIKKESGSKPITKLIDYDLFCGVNRTDSEEIKHITPSELKKLIDSKADIQIIDVRTQTEYNKENLNGDLIPLDQLEKHIDKISQEKQVIVHCQSGARSFKAIQILQSKYGFKNLYNLTGLFSNLRSLIVDKL